MVMLTVPLSALQAAASKSAAAGPAERRTQSRSIRVIALVSVAAAIPVPLAAPLLVSAFHLPTLLDALVLGPFVGISIALAIVRGRLLGLDQRTGIRAVAATFVISTVVRVGLALALLGTVGTSAAIARDPGRRSACARLRHPRPAAATSAATHAAGLHPWLRWSDVGWSGLAIGGLFLFTTIDLFLARHFLPGDASGAYVAAATIGKTLLALPPPRWRPPTRGSSLWVGRGPGRGDPPHGHRGRWPGSPRHRRRSRRPRPGPARALRLVLRGLAATSSACWPSSPASAPSSASSPTRFSRSTRGWSLLPWVGAVLSSS